MSKKSNIPKEIELITWNSKVLGQNTVMCTAGFITRESKAYVWVANSEGNQGYIDITRIPKRDLISRRHL